VLCFVASFLRLGFIANFLSRPILTGFMTGIRCRSWSVRSDA
jgi:MFS superfamily sulfate permease-like transporter